MRKIVMGIIAVSLGIAVSVHAANLWELRDGSNVTQVNITDAATPVIEQADLSGNAGTSTALAADPSDCAANEFADAIAASGDLTCNAIVDADVPNGITIDLAATATALAADPSDCAANEFADAIAASGNLTCNAIVDADVPDSITVDLAATATALAADPADCGDGFYALGVDAGGVAVCSAVNDTDGGVDASTAAVSANVLFDHEAKASVHHTATVNTNADTICSGTDVYLDGEGNCDTLVSVPEFEGRDTTANICADTPAQTGNFRISSDDFDLYTSTGTGVGDWRNSRTGVGAC